MQTLKTIRDLDLGLNTPEPAVWRKRTTGRAVVFDGHKKVALLNVTKKHYHKLPGGGVEKGENVDDALRRELVEEIGCEITNIAELGVVEEYRSGLSMHQTSYGFIADASGNKKASAFTRKETGDGFTVMWLPLDEATETLEREVDVKDYEGKFINARELAFLRAARDRQQRPNLINHQVHDLIKKHTT